MPNLSQLDRVLVLLVRSVSSTSRSCGRARASRSSRMRRTTWRRVAAGCQASGEEELEQAEVAKLVAGAGRCAASRSSARSPAAGEPVERARAARPLGALSDATRPVGLEPSQLGIDLPVAGGPEEARRVVDEALHVVPGHGPQAEEAEDHGPQRRSRRIQIYHTDISRRKVWYTDRHTLGTNAAPLRHAWRRSISAVVRNPGLTPILAVRRTRRPVREGRGVWLYEALRQGQRGGRGVSVAALSPRALAAATTSSAVSAVRSLGDELARAPRPSALREPQRLEVQRLLEHRPRVARVPEALRRARPPSKSRPSASARRPARARTRARRELVRDREQLGAWSSPGSEISRAKRERRPGFESRKRSISRG